MNHPAGRKEIASRIIRAGAPVPDEQYWDNATPEEWMNAVWELTHLCYFWQTGEIAEPRLQKSVTHVIRPKN